VKLKYYENKKIIFLADFYKEKLLGGAESNDAILISHLSNNSPVDKLLCTQFHERLLGQDYIFLISNFVSLSDVAKARLENEEYIIYEHDHKYLKSRDPSVYKDFIAPPDDLRNQSFYQNAKAVVVLSSICKEIIEKNLHLKNVHNIGCSIWSDEKLDFIHTLSLTPKNKKFAIINSSNPIKNTHMAVKYCIKKKIAYDIIQPCGEKELLSQLAHYQGLVFFPGVLETFSRIAAEAKMLNCQLLTKPKLLGFASEGIFTLSGDQLIETIRHRKNNALRLFSRLTEGEEK
tara:strand:- start:7980 stop:8846 length:867 start_codon:yes stop_codon:yes gene_type:complete